MFTAFTVSVDIEELVRKQIVRAEKMDNTKRYKADVSLDEDLMLYITVTEDTEGSVLQ